MDHIMVHQDMVAVWSSNRYRQLDILINYSFLKGNTCDLQGLEYSIYERPW